MRVALVTARFRARAPFDLRSQVRSLAPALARAGADVEVFCAVGDEAGLAPFAQRRAEIIDHAGGGATFGVTSVALPPRDTAPPDLEVRLAEGFAAFLDRERPMVVHFEQLDGFGTGLVREAKARGIRTVYCASDTWPAHDRASLLLPNLEPFELGDGDAEARALLVEEEFGAGPHTAASLERSHGAAAPGRMRQLLSEPLTDLEDVARLREACEAVEQRRAAKRVALSAVDRRFATTRLLAKNLSASVGRAFTFRAAGVDRSLFQGPSAPREAARSPRIAVFGDTSLEGGVELFLDAIEALGDGAADLRPSLHLECGDPGRDARVADRARQLGVETRWTRGPADVAGAIRGADLVVVPARWGEVCPAACRVALATGTPIIASRTPGVTEGVPSTAASLVTPADTAALAAALGALTGEGGTLPGLAGGAYEASRATKSVDDEAREWLDTYAQLRADASAGPAGPAAPPRGAIAGVARRLEELQALSHAELFALAQEGIGKLRRAFGLQDGEGDLLARAVARGGHGRDRAMLEARTRRELETSLDELRAVREAMAIEEAARERRVADLQGILHQYEAEVLAERDAALAESEERARQLERAVEEERVARAASEESTAAARGEAESLGADLEAIRSDLADARRAIDDAEAERAQLARTLDERDALARAVRERIGADEPREAGDLGAELASIEAFAAALERDTEELRRHDAWMGEQAQRLARALGTTGQVEGEDLRGEDALRDGIERACDSLRALTAELDWRRGEMVAAREAGSALRARFLAGPLARRVLGWDRADAAAWAPIPMDRTDAAPEPLSEQGSEQGSEQAPAPDADAAEDTTRGTTGSRGEGSDDPPAPLPSTATGEKSTGS